MRLIYDCRDHFVLSQALGADPELTLNGASIYIIWSCTDLQQIKRWPMFFSFNKGCIVLPFRNGIRRAIIQKNPKKHNQIFDLDDYTKNSRSETSFSLDICTQKTKCNFLI